MFKHDTMLFDEVYKRHYNELRKFGHHLNIPAERCDDLTQETFLKFYIEIKKNVIFDNPRAWLYKVYLNLFRTGYKCSKKEDLPGEFKNDRESCCSDLHEDFIKTERQKIVFGLLEKLETRDKELLLLYNKGLSYAEIAEVLDINPNSVGTMLVRAIERLKENIKIHCHELFEQN